MANEQKASKEASIRYIKSLESNQTIRRQLSATILQDGDQNRDFKVNKISQEELNTISAINTEKQGDVPGDYYVEQMKVFISTIHEGYSGKSEEDKARVDEIINEAVSHIAGSATDPDASSFDLFNGFMGDINKVYGDVDSVKKFTENWTASFIEAVGGFESLDQIVQENGYGNGENTENLDQALGALDSDPDTQVPDDDNQESPERKAPEKDVDPHQRKKDAMAAAVIVGTFFVPIFGPMIGLAIAAAYAHHRLSKERSPSEGEKEFEALNKKEMDELKAQIDKQNKADMREQGRETVPEGQEGDPVDQGGPEIPEEVGPGLSEAGSAVTQRAEVDLTDAQSRLETAENVLSQASQAGRGPSVAPEVPPQEVGVDPSQPVAPAVPGPEVTPATTESPKVVTQPGPLYEAPAPKTTGGVPAPEALYEVPQNAVDTSGIVNVNPDKNGPSHTTASAGPEEVTPATTEAPTASASTKTWAAKHPPKGADTTPTATTATPPATSR